MFTCSGAEQRKYYGVQVSRYAFGLAKKTIAGLMIANASIHHEAWQYLYRRARLVITARSLSFFNANTESLRPEFIQWASKFRNICVVRAGIGNSNVEPFLRAIKAETDFITQNHHLEVQQCAQNSGYSASINLPLTGSRRGCLANEMDNKRDHASLVEEFPWASIRKLKMCGCQTARDAFVPCQIHQKARPGPLRAHSRVLPYVYVEVYNDRDTNLIEYRSASLITAPKGRKFKRLFNDPRECYDLSSDDDRWLISETLPRYIKAMDEYKTLAEWVGALQTQP